MNGPVGPRHIAPWLCRFGGCPAPAVIRAPLALALVFAPRNGHAQTAGRHSLDTPEARAAATVFRAFVKARRAYDVPKVIAMRSADYVWVEFTGERRPGNPTDLQNIVEWEKVMDTKWECRILGYEDGALEVEMRERNRLYEILGIGAAIRRQRERISDGLLRESRVVDLRFTGRTQDEGVTEFTDWLRLQPVPRQEGVLRNGHLVFTAESARRELPLLEEWSRTHGDHSSAR
jgi:hypothetical protein